MFKYEIAWTENGTYHFKGFKYREQFDRYIKRLNKRNATILKTMIDFKEVR